jgi:hypothetical protein
MDFDEKYRDKRVFSKTAPTIFFKNTHFGMRKVSPKTPHTQFLCCFQLYKKKKKMERRLHPSWGYYLLEETSSSFRWVWDFDVASDQLSAQPRQSFKL